MTTVVDWLIFWVFEKFIPPVAGEFINKISPNIIAYAVAWFGAVIFAYVCSKLFVFERDDEATSFEKEGIVSQFIKFFLSRFATLVLSKVGDFVLCSETVGIELNADDMIFSDEEAEYAREKGCSMTGPEDAEIRNLNVLTEE